MSLTNATLLRVDLPQTPTTGGDVAYATGAAMNVRCVVDDPTTVVQRLIDALNINASAVLYVRLADWPSAGSLLAINCVVNVQQDGQAAQLFRIEHSALKVFGGLSHVQCLLKAM